MVKAKANEIRVLSGKMRVAQKENDYLYSVQLELLDDRITGNGWRYENLEEHRAMFAGNPILIAYTRNGRKVGDGHNFKMKRAKDGSQYASFTDAESERIIGSLSDDEKDITIVNRDGHTWIAGKGTIWAWYAREAVEKLAVQGSMDVSIETLVTQNRIEDGVEIEEKYIPLGVTILGDDVTPAVAGANIRPLSQENVGELKLRASSYMGQKPQKDKGVRKMASNQRMKELVGMFPDYKVLGASEDGMTAVLCSKTTGDVYGYTFNEGDENTVLDSRFNGIQPVLSIALNGESMNIRLDNFFKEVSETIEGMSRELKACQTAKEDAEKALADMKDAEIKRNREEAKKELAKTLEEINEVACEGEVVDEKVLEDIEKDIDNGEYDGECNAAEKACEVLNARIMKERTKKAQEALKAKRNSRTTYGWSDGVMGGEEADSVSDLLSRMGVN